MTNHAKLSQFTCPDCGLSMPGNALAGLCPACLLRTVMAAPSKIDTRTDTDFLSHAAGEEATLTGLDIGPVQREKSIAAVHCHEAQADDYPSAGTVLRYFGDYELREEIARGGMGVVYRARQVRLNRQVALKMIRAGKFSSETEIQRLRVEAEAAAQLDHPGIVPVFEVGEHEGLHYFTMAFVDGQTLSEKLRHGPLPVRAAADLMKKVAQAIAYAHEHGVIHRDIKPGNILIDKSGQPRISDFGLARQVNIDSELTTTGQILGTPSYMPPEQAQGHLDEVGNTSDIYALGATLYATLTGRPPFQAQTSVETLRLVVEELPLAPRLLNPSIPRDLETICLKCLEKSNSRRYGSAKEVAEELDRFLNGEPIVAQPAGPFRKLTRWYRRHWATATTGLSIVLMISVVAAVLAVTAGRLKSELTKTATAETAERQAKKAAQDRLWGSYLNEASARHRSRQSGQRFGALRAIEKALKIDTPAGRSRDELRTAAIAALCLPDLEFDTVWPHSCRTAQFAIDPSLRLFGAEDSKTKEFVVRDMASNEEWMRLKWASWNFEYQGPTFSPDAQLLVYPKEMDGEPQLHLWRVAKNQPPEDLGQGACSVTFRPDSQRCAVSYLDGRIRILDAQTFRELNHYETSMAGPIVVWNPMYPQLALMDKFGWRVIDVESGATLSELKVWQRLAGWPAWHPSGTRLAIATVDQRIRIWDSATTQPVADPLIGHRRGGTIVRFAPSGDHLVSNDWGQSIRLWDLRSGQPLISVPATGIKLQFSQDGSHLGADCAPEELRFFRYDAGREFRTIWEYPGRSSDFVLNHSVPCVNRTGRILAIRTREGLCLIDLLHDEIVCRLPIGGNGPFRFHESAEGESLWTYGGKGLLSWPIRINESVDEASIGPPTQLSDIASENTWSSSNGDVVFVPRLDGGLVWNRTTGDETVLPHSDVRTCMVSSDGRIGVTGSHADTDVGAIVWNLETHSSIAELNVSAGGVFLSPDAKWLVTNGGGTKLWTFGDWKNPRKIRSFSSHVCFSRDSQLIAHSDGVSMIRLLDPETGCEIAVLTTPERNGLFPIAFTPDNARLIALSEETATLHIFDLRAIRRQLAAMGLDWDFPPLPPEQALKTVGQPLKFEIRSSTDDGLLTGHRTALPEKSESVWVAPATTLEVSGKSDGLNLLHQDLSEFGHFPTPNHVLANGRHAGDFVDFAVPIFRPGRLRLRVQLTQAEDFGIVAFHVNGQRAEPTVDTYGPEVQPSRLIELGEFEVTNSPLTLRVEVVGTNLLSKPRHFYFALAAVVVEKPDATTETDGSPMSPP